MEYVVDESLIGKQKGCEGHDLFRCFVNKWHGESTLLGIILLQYYVSYPDIIILEPSFGRKQGAL